MIVRSKAKKWTTISNDTLEDSRLSFKATGLLAYLLSKPDKWKVQEEHLTRAKTDGSSAIRSALKELEAAGYLIRKCIRGDDGKIIRWDHVIYDEPQSGKPDLDFPDLDNHPLVNTEVVNTEDLASTETTIISFAGAKGESGPTEQQQWFQKICDIVGWDHKILTKEQQGQVAQTVGILRKADYTLQDLCDFGKKIWAKDWRWTEKKQRPTITQLRSEIGKLRAPGMTEVAKKEPQTAEEAWKEEGFDSLEAYQKFYKEFTRA